MLSMAATASCTPKEEPIREVESYTPLPVIQRDSLNASVSSSRRNAITEAIAKASPAVVGINVTEVREQRYVDPLDWFFEDPFFRRYRQAPSRTYKYKVKGLGSGFLISKDGYILTNDHVAGNAAEIIVTTTDGKQHSARLIASDRVSDVALLKIEGNDFPFIPMGNSDDLVIGEWAIAMGNPFGLFDINQKPTVTVGVISNTNVNLGLQEDRNYRGMVQTDAAISSGNSGGPLLNAAGECIGVNATIFSTAQGRGGEAGSIGLGFAIPVNRVKKIVEELRAGRPARAPLADLGIQGVELNERLRSEVNAKVDEGVVIVQMYRKSPAERAGLEPGDVITSVDNERVRTWEEFQSVITDKRPGQTVALQVHRGGDDIKIPLKLEAQKVTGR